MIASSSVTAWASRSCLSGVIELFRVSMSSGSASVQRLPVSDGDRIPTVRQLGLWSITAGPTSNAFTDERPSGRGSRHRRMSTSRMQRAMKVATSSAFSAVAAGISTFSVKGSCRSRHRA